MALYVLEPKRYRNSVVVKPSTFPTLIGVLFISKQLKLNVDYLCCFAFPDAYTNMLLLGGFESYQYHRYWCNARKSLDLEGMLEDLRNAPENTPVLLQACGHNPSGVDPTQEQWREIADVMEVTCAIIQIKYL